MLLSPTKTVWESKLIMLLGVNMTSRPPALVSTVLPPDVYAGLMTL